MLINTEQEARAYVAQFCDAGAIERLERFVELLAAENLNQNLIASNTVASVWVRHIADSAQLLSYVPRETEGTWLDLGTGAGFPGIVIAIMRPELPVKLVESRNRRVDWLQTVADNLTLQNCEVIGSRLELVQTFRADFISARAFAPLPKLIDISSRFSTNDTLWLLPKGRSAAQDLASLPKSKNRLFHVEQSVTDSEAGIIVGTLENQMRRKS